MDIKTEPKDAEEPEDQFLDLSIVKEEYVVQEEKPLISEIDLKPSLEASQECQENQYSQEKQERVKFVITEIHTRKYSCSLCCSSFHRAKDLKKHISTHTNEKNFSCPQCPKAFATPERLESHRKTHTEATPFACTHCEKSFKNLLYLKKHLKTHAEKTQECPKCGKKFKDVEYLKKHTRRHIDGKSFECDKCGKLFKTVKARREHNQNFHMGYRLCPKCPMKLADEAALREHVQMHASEKPLHCQVCQKTFKYEAMLRKHSRRHTETFTTCPYCQKVNGSRAAFRWHMANYHRGMPTEIKDGPVSCRICNEVFETLDQLKEHVVAHPIEKLYECAFCGKKFITKIRVKEHIQTVHYRIPRMSNITLFACTVCGQQCHGRTNLQIHQSTHSTDRPFKCSLCGKTFKNEPFLMRHMRALHNDERPVFECRICGIKLKQKRSLREHERKHETTPDTFTCPQCGEMFRGKRLLDEHMKEQHGDLMFPCKICGVRLKHKRSMTKHEKMHMKEISKLAENSIGSSSK
uniref:C2H2-type domain-containing protein n=2 Tax=Lutzomyia longipalpis TaxID=7200 RepID=A0A1B0GKT9_LUTLO